jgi:phage tail sheath gpL-like
MVNTTNIATPSIPSNLRNPGVYIENDNSNANTSTPNPRTNIVAQMLSTGNAVANIAFLATSQTQVSTMTGAGSLASYVYNHYSTYDNFAETWITPVVDNPGGSKASMVVTINGTATQAGTLNLYVLGDNQQILVNSGDTSNTVATNLAIGINAGNSVGQPLPVTANVTANSVVTITSRHNGTFQGAGDIPVYYNYRGAAANEFAVPGIGVTITAGVAGTGDPILDTALMNLGTQQYDTFLSPYSGTTQLLSFQNFFSDTSGRWSWSGNQLDGAVWTATRNTGAGLQSYGTGNNSQHVNTLGFYDTPEPAYIWAADFVATVAPSLRSNPATPLQNMQMNVLPPPPQSRFSPALNNTLLYSGISTFETRQDNTVWLKRCVTNYQTNAGGAPDNSYLDSETPYQLMFAERFIAQDMETKFARCILVADGSNIPYGSNLVTSQIVLAEAIADYRKLCDLQMMQNPDVFAKAASAENQGNGTVALYLPLDLANQLRIIKIVVAFQKT